MVFCALGEHAGALDEPIGGIGNCIICPLGPHDIVGPVEVVPPGGAIDAVGIIIDGEAEPFPAPLSFIGGGKGGCIIIGGYWGIICGYGMKGGIGTCAGARCSCPLP